MIIELFTSKNGLDELSIKGGVYYVELKKKGMQQTISLYIGESGCMVKRCGEHLCKLLKDERYFGLLPEDLENNDLILCFSVLESIKKERVGRRDLYYESVENKWKEKKNETNRSPLTQHKTNDNMIKRDKRVKVVQCEMRNLGFKV